MSRNEPEYFGKLDNIIFVENDLYNQIEEDTIIVRDSSQPYKTFRYIKPSGVSSKNADDFKSRPTGKYYLIVGSFKDYENAVKIKQMIEGSVIIYSDDNLKRVAKDSFSSREEAIQVVTEYKKNNPNSIVWLYSK
jgi:cell division protein FtsN